MKKKVPNGAYIDLQYIYISRLMFKVQKENLDKRLIFDSFNLSILKDTTF